MKATRLLTVLAMVVLLTACRKVPTTAARALDARQPDQTGSPTSTGGPSSPLEIEKFLTLYERKPGPEAASAVWESFSALRDRISALKLSVATTAGGVRAEAEVERIELQQLYDQALARFAAVHGRIQAATAILDVLTAASGSADGIQAAPSILVHGPEKESSGSPAWVRERSTLTAIGDL